MKEICNQPFIHENLMHLCALISLQQGLVLCVDQTIIFLPLVIVAVPHVVQLDS